MDTKTHTLGFIFDKTLSKVLLIEKQRPDWQCGILNGIGGKIEVGEKSVACIVREVEEETGLSTSYHHWTYIGSIEGSEWSVDIYAKIHKADLNDAQTMTDEEIGWHDVSLLPENTIPNLKWLIPLAIDKLKNDQFHHCNVTYR